MHNNIVATSFLEQHREGARLQGILFQICYEYKVCRLNNILNIGNPRDTDSRQCIHNQTNLIYCVNSDYLLIPGPLPALPFGARPAKMFAVSAFTRRKFAHETGFCLAGVSRAGLQCYCRAGWRAGR